MTSLHLKNRPVKSRSEILYRLSKAVYLILLEVSIVVDLILALAGYDWLKTIMSAPASLAIVALIVSGVLAAVIYLLHMWQIERLTGNHNDE